METDIEMCLFSMFFIGACFAEILTGDEGLEDK